MPKPPNAKGTSVRAPGGPTDDDSAATWSETEVSDFLDLTQESHVARAEKGLGDTTSLSDLAAALGGATLDHMRETKLQKLYAEMTSHSVFRKLTNKRAFPGIVSIIDARKRASRRLPRLDGVAGEIRLMYIIAVFICKHEPDWRPTWATRDDQRAAYDASHRLLNVLKPGAQPVDWRQSSELRRLLGVLNSQLKVDIAIAEQTHKRTVRSDANAAQRYWVGALCRMLWQAFDGAPIGIVSAIAGGMGYTPDPSTLENYIAQARLEVARKKTGE